MSGPRQARVHPCPAAAEDELLRCAGEAAQRLDPAFDPPLTEVSREETSEPYSSTEVRRRLGTAEQGFEVVARSEMIDGPWTTTVETAEVSAYGLAAGCALRLRHAGWELTIEAAGPEAAVEEVLDAATAAFTRPLTAAQLETLAGRAQGALRGGDWARAISDAEAVLRQDPDSTAALLALGIAHGASGDLVPAHRALVAALERTPREHDAWYNLGNVHRTRRAHGRAAACYRTVLAIDAGNHPAHYQLGCVLEAAGRTEAAIAAYRDALRTSPNPEGTWAFSGMDLTKAAREALARLGAAAQGRKGRTRKKGRKP